MFFSNKKQAFIKRVQKTFAVFFIYSSLSLYFSLSLFLSLFCFSSPSPSSIAHRTLHHSIMYPSSDHPIHYRSLLSSSSSSSSPSSPSSSNPFPSSSTGNHYYNHNHIPFSSYSPHSHQYEYNGSKPASSSPSLRAALAQLFTTRTLFLVATLFVAGLCTGRFLSSSPSSGWYAPASAVQSGNNEERHEQVKTQYENALQRAVHEAATLSNNNAAVGAEEQQREESMMRGTTTRFETVQHDQQQQQRTQQQLYAPVSSSSDSSYNRIPQTQQIRQEQERVSVNGFVVPVPAAATVNANGNAESQQQQHNPRTRTRTPTEEREQAHDVGIVPRPVSQQRYGTPASSSSVSSSVRGDEKHTSVPSFVKNDESRMNTVSQQQKQEEQLKRASIADRDIGRSHMSTPSSRSTSASTSMKSTSITNDYHPQQLSQSHYEPPQEQRHPVSVPHTTTYSTSFSSVHHDAATTARFLARLGLDDAVFGKLYYTLPLHTSNNNDHHSATLPYCFAHSMAPALAALCPVFWPSSTVRPCGGGTDGYTCMETRTQRKKEEEVKVKVECGMEFAPVCCQINERVHATHNYCECKAAGGIFRRAGANCEGVGTIEEEMEEH